MIGHLMFWFLMDKIGAAARKEDELRHHPGYGKMRCPSCRGWVFPKELERRGCYLCGWKEEAEPGGARA